MHLFHNVKSRAAAALSGGLVCAILCLCLFSGVAVRALASDAASSALRSAETLRLGERMYREGILPSGESMKAFVSGDVPVSGTAFTCVSCHLRSGLGSEEGNVLTPPTNGRILYQQSEPFIKGQEFVPSIHNYAVNLPVRPAYTDETLAALITTGYDPTGRSVIRVMPRYDLNDSDMAILISYLKTLSDKPSPGVSSSEIKFATVIIEGVDPLAVQSMLEPIQFAVDRKNSVANASERSDKVGRMAYNMLGNLTTMRFSLAKWILKGPSTSWRQQLEEYYKAEPVFALLGGISDGEWEPVHRFCEEHGVPNLIPIVDYPVISDTDWYTLYPSRGVRQEGEAAARYLHTMQELIKDRPILQVIRDSRRGRTLAEGFSTEWGRTGHAPPAEIMLGEGEVLTAEKLQKIISRHRPAVLVVWDDASLLAALAGIAHDPNRPGLVLASGEYLGKDLWTMPEPLRGFLYMTYPYRLPQEEVRYDKTVRKVLSGKPLESFDQRILKQAFMAEELLGKALVDMRGEYYRDFFLDTIGMMKDMFFPLYERVSFGPGQRYASKGCFIVQLSKGEKPRLERRSEWVTQ